MLYLLPVPQEIVEKKGHFLFTINSSIILSDSCNGKEFSYAKILQNELQKTLATKPSVRKGKPFGHCIFIEKLGNLDNENYTVDITEDMIKITATGTRGLLYGVETLRQMSVQCGVDFPCVHINDSPLFANRGFFHDVTRGRVPTLATLKSLADTAAYYKLNQLQLNIEHTFLFHDFSEVWRDDTPITGEEIIELDEYCKSLNIDLVPSIASFGHLYKVLSTKTYEPLCELEGAHEMKRGFVNRQLHHTLNISDPSSIKFVEKMLCEYMPYFTSKYVNICADETFDLGRGKSCEMCEDRDKTEIYVSYLSQVCKIVSANRRIPMYWGDVLLENPEYIKRLPSNGICLNWGYSDEVTDESTRKLSQAGAMQYSCCGVSAWNRFIPHTNYAYSNITKMCSYAEKYNSVGILNTDWGDYGHINLPDFSLPAMIYGAMFSWNNAKIPFELANQMISVLAFGDNSQEFVSIVEEIADNSVFTWGDAVRFRESKLDEDVRTWVDANMPITPKFSDENKNKAITSNDAVDKLIDKLYSLLPNQNESKHALTMQYILMAEAVIIFNNIAAFTEHANTDMSPNETAVSLEYWWQDYKDLWRKNYKESELALLQETVFWFCDYLRDLG